MTVLITNLHLITSQIHDHLCDHLIDHLCLISDSISNLISGQIHDNLCDYLHDCPCDCLCNHLIDHCHSITGILHDQLRDHLHRQLHGLNSNITEAQDPGLGLWEAMAKDRRIVCLLIIHCCTTCMYILMASLMMGP